MNKQIIPIFFTIDDNFAPYLSVAIKSMLDNANKDYFYNVHIVHEGLSNENKNKLKQLETSNSSIIFNEMDNKLECIQDKLENRLRADIFTLSIYFRIFIPEMFQEYDKAIYLDSDIVVLGDISELYNCDLKGNLIGACIDKSVVGIKPIEDYFTIGVGVDYREYFNSGILLFDMKKMREVKLADKFLYLFNKYHFENIDPDQSYLNAMCYGKVLHLDNTWDTMPNDTFPPVENPKLIHYNLFSKPWRKSGVQYEEYFWKYAKETNYYDTLIEELNNTTIEDLKKDEETLNFMLQRCEEIINIEKGTFKDIFDNGIEERL